MVKSIEEDFKALKALGLTITPFNLKNHFYDNAKMVFCFISAKSNAKRYGYLSDSASC